jgi:hypothetical protein
MSRPIAPTKGIAFAFPDVCKTPTAAGPVPVPYPNIADLSQAQDVTDLGGKEVLVGPAGLHALLMDSTVATSTGDEAGSVGGVTSGTIKGQCKVTGASGSVVYGPQAKGLARFLDATSHNKQNAQGIVLATFPKVLVGD